MTNILVIPTTDWTQHPVPNRLNHIFERIHSMGNRVSVLAFHYEKYVYNDPRHTKCSLIYAGTAEGDISSFYVKNYTMHKNIIRAVCADEDIDVILSANILPSYAAIDAGVPIVYDYLDVMDEAACAYLTGAKKIIGKYAVNFLMKHVLNNASQIITVSPGLVGYIKQKYCVKNNRIPVIPNGVDLNVFKPLDKKRGRELCGVTNYLPIIGYVGSVEKWVDLETPIRALKDISANLVIIGPSLHTDERLRLQELAENQHRAGKGKVIFIDAVPYNDLPKYISGFDVGINPLMPSAHNIYSAGGKIFNYMACGIPVVSTECDPGSIVKQHLRIYSTPEEYHNIIDSLLDPDTTYDPKDARDVMKYYDWDVLAKKYEEVLESVV